MAFQPAHFIIRYRWTVLAVWTLLTVLAVPRAAVVHEALSVEGAMIPDSDSERAVRTIRAAFPLPVADFFAVTLTGAVAIDSAQYLALLDSLSRRAEAEPYISHVISYLDTPDSTLVSPDRRTTFMVAALRTDNTLSNTDYVPAFREAIHGTIERISWGAAYRANVTGAPALDYDVREVSKEDTDRGERRSLPFTAVILVLAFGAFLAALLPLGVGVIAIVASLAAVQIVSGLLPMSVFVLTLVSMVGLGVGIDYSLLIVTRFREELNRGHSARQAAIRTIETAGRAVVTSGLTVVVGFASLLITPLTETRSVGVGGLIVVAAAVMLSVTLLPAVLSILGRTIDWPRWLARRLSWYHAPTGWERWARWLGHHPWRAIAMGLLAIGVISYPITQIKIGLPRAGWFPSGTESNAGVEDLERIGAQGVLQPVRVVVQAPEGDRIVSARYLRGLRRLSDSLRADARVANVRSVVDVQPGMSALRYTMLYSNLESARTRAPEFYAAYLSQDAATTLFDVFLSDTTSITSAMDVVRRIRSIVTSGVRGLDSTTIVVGGFYASGVDLQDRLLAQFPIVVVLILISTAVMLAIAFRSVLVPLKAIVMNALSVAATFGLVVLVFQHGIGSSILGLDGPTEAVFVVVPVLVFAVVFGLSMDYEVFLLSRIKESFVRTGRNDQATMEGLTATASVITSAAAIMVIVFGTFAFSRVLAAQMLGFGLAVAVLLDATLIRMVLVPAFMHVAGRWNWWPGIRNVPVRQGSSPSVSGPRVSPPDLSPASPAHLSDPSARPARADQSPGS
jgi:RND superfamily putative drug exporter